MLSYMAYWRNVTASKLLSTVINMVIHRLLFTVHTNHVWYNSVSKLTLSKKYVILFECQNSIHNGTRVCHVYLSEGSHNAMLSISYMHLIRCVRPLYV